MRSNASPAKRSRSGRIFFARAMTSSPPRCCGGAERESEWRREPMALHSNDRWHGRFTPPRARLVPVRDRGLDRPVRHLAQGIPPQAAGRPGRHAGGARGRCISSSELMPRARKARAGGRGGGEEIRKHAATARCCSTKNWRPPWRETEMRPDLTRSHVVPLVADRERARAGAWYEMVPRSQSTVPGRHGTFDDCIARRAGDRRARLRRALSHADPSDRAHQPQGQEQHAECRARTIPAASTPSATSTAATTRCNPELGTLADFRRLVEACTKHDMEIALDFAVQCAPDHPWLKQHPEWFRTRPDGTIKFAENPPKKYEDIVNPDFSLRRAHRAVGGLARRLPVLGRARA